MIFFGKNVNIKFNCEKSFQMLMNYCIYVVKEKGYGCFIWDYFLFWFLCKGVEKIDSQFV